MRAASAGASERKRHYDEFIRPKSMAEQIERFSALDATSRAPLPVSVEHQQRSSRGGSTRAEGIRGTGKYREELPIDISDSRKRREVFMATDGTRDMTDKALTRVVDRREARRTLVADAPPEEALPDPWELQLLLMKHYTSFGNASANDLNDVLHSKGVVAELIHRHADSAELRSGIQHEIGLWVAEVTEKQAGAQGGSASEELEDRLLDMKREAHELNASMHVLDAAVDKMESSMGQLTNVHASIESLHRRAIMSEMNLFGDTAQRKSKTRTVGSGTELTFNCGLSVRPAGGAEPGSPRAQSPRAAAAVSPRAQNSPEEGPVSTAEIIASNADALQQQASKEEEYIQQILRLDAKLTERHDLIIDLMTMLENRNRQALKEATKHQAGIEAKNAEILLLQTQLESIRTGRAFSELWKALDEHDDGSSVKALIQDVVRAMAPSTAAAAAGTIPTSQPDMHSDKKWLTALQMVREKEASGALFQERNELLLKVKRLEESVANSISEAEHQSDLLADMSDKYTAADRERQHFKALSQFMERDSHEKTQRITELEKQVRDALFKLNTTETDSRAELDRLKRYHEQAAMVLQKTIAELRKAVEKSEQEDSAVLLRAANVKVHELDIANRSLKSLAGAMESRMEDVANELRLVTRVAAASLQNMSKSILALRKQTTDTTSGRMLDMLRMCSWKATQDLLGDVQSVLRAIMHHAAEEPSIQSTADLLSTVSDESPPPSDGDEGVVKLEQEIQRLVMLQRETMTRYRQMETEASEMKRKRHQVLNTVRDAVTRLVSRKSLLRPSSNEPPSPAAGDAAEKDRDVGSSMLESFGSGSHPPPARRRTTTSLLSNQSFSQRVFDGVEQLVREPQPALTSFPSWGGRGTSFRRRSSLSRDEDPSCAIPSTTSDKLEDSSGDLDATTGSAQRALLQGSPSMTLSSSTSHQFDGMGPTPQALVVDRLYHDEESQKVLDDIFSAGHEQIIAAEEELENNLQEAVDTTAQAQRKVMEAMAAAAAPSYNLLHGALTMSEVLRSLSMEVATRVVGPIEAALALHGDLGDGVQARAAPLISAITKELPAKNRKLLIESVKLRILARGRLEAYRIRVDDRIRSMVTLRDAEDAAAIRRRMHVIEQDFFAQNTRILVELAEVHRKRLMLTEELVNLVSCSSQAELIMPHTSKKSPASPSMADQLHEHVTRSMASTRDACNSPVVELIRGGSTAEQDGVIASLKQKIADGAAVVAQYEAALVYVGLALKDPSGSHFMDRVARCPAEELRKVKRAVEAVVQGGAVAEAVQQSTPCPTRQDDSAAAAALEQVGTVVADQYKEALQNLSATVLQGFRRIATVAVAQPRETAKLYSGLQKADALRRVGSCPEVLFLEASTLLSKISEQILQSIADTTAAVSRIKSSSGNDVTGKVISPRSSKSPRTSPAQPNVQSSPPQTASAQLSAEKALRERDAQITKLSAELTDAKTKLHQLLKDVASEKYRHIEAKGPRHGSCSAPSGQGQPVPVFMSQPTVLGAFDVDPAPEQRGEAAAGALPLSFLSIAQTPPVPVKLGLASGQSLPTYVMPSITSLMDTPVDTPVLEMVDHSCSPLHFESRPASAVRRPSSAKRPTSALERRVSAPSVGVSDGFTQTATPTAVAVLELHTTTREADEEFSRRENDEGHHHDIMREDQETQTGEDLLADFITALLRLPLPMLVADADETAATRSQRRPLRMLPQPMTSTSTPSVERQWTTLRSRLHRLVHDAKRSSPPPQQEPSSPKEAQLSSSWIWKEAPQSGPTLSVVDIPPAFVQSVARTAHDDAASSCCRTLDASIELYPPRRDKTDLSSTSAAHGEVLELHDSMAEILRLGARDRSDCLNESSAIVHEFYQEASERARDAALHRPVTALEREKLRIAMRTAEASRGASRVCRSASSMSHGARSGQEAVPGVGVDVTRGLNGSVARALSRGSVTPAGATSSIASVSRLQTDPIHLGPTAVTLVVNNRRTTAVIAGRK